MEKVLDIIDALAHEKGLPPKDLKEAFANAMIKAAQKLFGEEKLFEAVIDEASRKIRLYQKFIVVANNDPRLGGNDDANYITLDEAREYGEGVEIGDEMTIEIDLADYGRSAATQVQREFDFQLQRLTENQIYNRLKQKQGKIVSGVVSRIDSDENTIIEIGELRAILPRKNRIKGESFKPGQTVKALLKNLFFDKNRGIIVELSRTAPKFLEELLALEVPEIKDEMIIIHGVSRIPGERAKVSISTTSPRIDPVGATVGTKGVRINAVSRELCNENIDIIEYSAIPEIYVARALSPAIVEKVLIQHGHKALVTVPLGQKAKAIGRSGLNIRLASMLTGYEIEIIENELSSTPSEESRDDESGGMSALASLFKN
ncbi:MAG: transcription termination factor NusA [Campylobacterales bacterium]